MTTFALRPAPSGPAVARIQLRAVGMALAKPATIYVAVLLGIAAVVFLLEAIRRLSGNAVHADTSSDPRELIPFLVLWAVIMAVRVWPAEGPSHRTYHLSMPAPRGAHTLMKMLAGWVWVLAGGAVLQCVMIGADALEALAVGQPWAIADVQTWHWMMPLGAASVAYALTSVVALLSDHPWVWIVGISAAVAISFGTLMAGAAAGPPFTSSASRAVLDVLAGRYGAMVPLSGVVVSIPARVANSCVVFPDGVFENAPYAALGVWLRATLLWFGIGLAGAVGASYTYRGA